MNPINLALEGAPKHIHISPWVSCDGCSFEAGVRACAEVIVRWLDEVEEGGNPYDGFNSTGMITAGRGHVWPYTEKLMSFVTDRWSEEKK